VSKPFDPTDKKNQHYLDYFREKTWLIIEVSASTRSSIKKTIMQLGVVKENFFDAIDFNQANELIETSNPDFIITNKVLVGGSGLDLFSRHLKASPNRLESGFFILSDENSIAEIALVLEYEVDGMISLPFTGATIQNSIIEGVKDKIKPTSYQQKSEEGRVHYINKKFIEAKACLKAANLLDKKPFLGEYLLGQVFHDEEKLVEATQSYEKSIAANAHYYKPMSRLTQIYYQNKEYEKAYNLNLLMAQKYPIPPHKIPELIRLSIFNKKYEDIVNYSTLFNTIKNPSEEMQKYLSAGTAILGKYFFSNNEYEKGIEAFKTSFKNCNGKYEILKSITSTCEEHGKIDFLFELLEKSDLEKWPSSAQVFHFYTMHLTSTNDQQIITYGEKLIKNKVKDPMVYKVLIKRGIQAARKSSFIDGLVFEASNAFPDFRDEFNTLAKKS
jgi:DNA-binding response OmpR family regulator